MCVCVTCTCIYMSLIWSPFLWGANDICSLPRFYARFCRNHGDTAGFFAEKLLEMRLACQSSLNDPGIFFSGIDRGNVRGISSLIELATFFCLLQHLWSNINIGLNNIQQIIIKFDQI